MKIFSDRNTIRWITKFGLMSAIVAEGVASTGRITWIFIVGICVPLVVSSIFFDLKNYRKLIFKDEQYPEKANEATNIVISIVFPVGYMFLITPFYYITEDLNYDLNWSTWALIVNFIYFGSAFIFFINRICTK
jgi:hypothetical protein